MMGMKHWTRVSLRRRQHLQVVGCILLLSLQGVVPLSQQDSSEQSLTTDHSQGSEPRQQQTSPKQHGLNTDLRSRHLKQEQQPVVTVQKESISATQTLPSTSLSPSQNILLQHAVKDLLGFHALPGDSTTRGPHVPGEGNTRGSSSSQDLKGKDQAPRYMKKLYEKYKYGGSISDGQHFSNTVRSISATIEMVSGEPMFVFNLSCVSRSEVLLSSDLHVYRKRPKSRDNSEVRAHMLLHHEAAPLRVLRMTSSRFGWQAYDVTSAVQESRGEHAQRLAISFRSGDQSETLPLKHFIRHNIALPFLIVFSNDTQNITLDHIDPHFRQGQDQGLNGKEDVIIDPEFGVEVPLFGGRGRGRKRPKGHQKHHHSTESKLESVEESSFEDEIELSTEELKQDLPVETRQRRSIYDNEIPEHPTDSVKPDAPYNVPRTHPGILEGRNHALRHQVPVTSSEQLIPYPEEYEKQDGSVSGGASSRRRGRRRKGRRNRKRKEKRERGRKEKTRTLPFPEEWEQEIISHRENTVKVTPGLGGVPQQQTLCGRRRLSVDFADIGWSDWIISPRSFEAHYCAGTCPFPLTKTLRPSNHATIQALVHAVGLHADVPAPCCVPASLSSVTLLYYDENRNVVLKNYPNMSVESCACR